MAAEDAPVTPRLAPLGPLVPAAASLTMTVPGRTTIIPAKRPILAEIRTEW